MACPAGLSCLHKQYHAAVFLGRRGAASKSKYIALVDDAGNEVKASSYRRKPVAFRKSKDGFASGELTFEVGRNEEWRVAKVALSSNAESGTGCICLRWDFRKGKSTRYEEGDVLCWSGTYKATPGAWKYRDGASDRLNQGFTKYVFGGEEPEVSGHWYLGMLVSAGHGTHQYNEHMGPRRELIFKAANDGVTPISMNAAQWTATEQLLVGGFALFDGPDPADPRTGLWLVRELPYGVKAVEPGETFGPGVGEFVIR